MQLDKYLVQGGGGVAGISSSVRGKFTFIFIISQKKRCCFYLCISFHDFVSFLLGKQKVSQCGSTNEGV